MDFTFASLLVAFLASLAQGVTGFGFALILVPLLSLVYDPKAVVLISLSLGLLTKIPLLIVDRRHIQWRVIAPLVGVTLVGNTLGAQVILSADQALLRLGIGVLVVVLSALLLLDFRWQIKREWLATAVVGLVSGFLTGSTSMGGPPVVLFGVNQAWAKESLRANLVAFFTISALFTTALLAASGALTREILLLDAYMLPGIAVGLWVGNFAFRRVPRVLLYRGIVLFVLVTGLFGTYSSASGLLRG